MNTDSTSSDDLSPGDNSGTHDSSSADSSSEKLEQVSLEWTKLLGSAEEETPRAITTGLDGQTNSGERDACISKLDLGFEGGCVCLADSVSFFDCFKFFKNSISKDSWGLAIKKIKVNITIIYFLIL